MLQQNRKEGYKIKHLKTRDSINQKLYIEKHIKSIPWPFKNKTWNQNKGFSLMSLVIVIVVIAILVIIAVPYFIGKIEEARFARIVHDARVIQDAADRYWMDHEETFWDQTEGFIVEINSEGEDIEGNREDLPAQFIAIKGTAFTLEEIIASIPEGETVRFYDINEENLKIASDYLRIRSDPSYYVIIKR